MPPRSQSAPAAARLPGRASAASLRVRLSRTASASIICRVRSFFLAASCTSSTATEERFPCRMKRSKSTDSAVEDPGAAEARVRGSLRGVSDQGAAHIPK